jgi:hypothetical protein
VQLLYSESCRLRTASAGPRNDHYAGEPPGRTGRPSQADSDTGTARYGLSGESAAGVPVTRTRKAHLTLYDGHGARLEQHTLHQDLEGFPSITDDDVMASLAWLRSFTEPGAPASRVNVPPGRRSVTVTVVAP